MKNNIYNVTFAILLLILFIFSFNMNLFSQEDSLEYRNGIYFEIRTDTANSARYTEDNEIYRAENIYYFTYTFKNKSNNEYFFYRSSAKTWEFVPKEEMKDSTIIGFFIKVMPDLGFYKRYPDYDQTVIEYTFVMKNGEVNTSFSEKTGLVENSMNIWVHPPRINLFRILEIIPFPFIQKPYKKGNKWRWSLEIGDLWGDARWKIWKGMITNQYKYVITDANNFVLTPLGTLKCYKIKSTAKSKIGKTSLVAYFNEIYGFVKLEYTNIDKSTITITLNNIK